MTNMLVGERKWIKILNNIKRKIFINPDECITEGDVLLSILQGLCLLDAFCCEPESSSPAKYCSFFFSDRFQKHHVRRSLP